MLSLNIAKTEAIAPATSPASSEPNRNQPISVITPPAAAEPSKRPSSFRIAPPSSRTGMMRNGLKRLLGSNDNKGPWL